MTLAATVQSEQYSQVTVAAAPLALTLVQQYAMPSSHGKLQAAPTIPTHTLLYAASYQTRLRQFTTMRLPCTCHVTLSHES